LGESDDLLMNTYLYYGSPVKIHDIIYKEDKVYRIVLKLVNGGHEIPVEGKTVLKDHTGSSITAIMAYLLERK